MLGFFLWALTKREVFDKIRPKVVMVNVVAHFNADRTEWFDSSDRWIATGFLIDREKGIIATNKHVAGYDAVCSYELEFSDGSKADAKLLYKDPFYDFAFLQVDPVRLPANMESIPFAEDAPHVNEEIFSVTNTHGSKFTPTEGTLSSLYENTGPFHEQSLEYSGITSFGASGSPVVNDKAQLVGIIYGGRFTSGRFLPAAYLKAAYQAFQKDTFPVRKTAGLVVRYGDLIEARTKGFLPREACVEYQKKYHNSGNKILQIRFMQKGSRAREVLQPEDIIWKINGKFLGPDLLALDQAINQSDSVKLGFYRRGAYQEVDLPCETVDRDNDKMISFSGAIFSELNLESRMRLDIDKKKAVFFHNAKRSSGFSEFLHGGIIEILQIDEFPIEDLDSLEKAIAVVGGRRKLAVHYINHGVENTWYAFETIRNTTPHLSVIKHDPRFDIPRVLFFNFDKKDWDSRHIEVKGVEEETSKEAEEAAAAKGAEETPAAKTTQGEAAKGTA